MGKIDCTPPSWRKAKTITKAVSAQEPVLEQANQYVAPPKKIIRPKAAITHEVLIGAAAFGTLHPKLQQALNTLFTLSVATDTPLTQADIIGGWEPLSGTFTPRSYIDQAGKPASLAVLLPESDALKLLARRVGLIYKTGGLVTLPYDKDTEMITRLRYETLNIQAK